MALLNKNIWLAFYFVSAIWVIFLGISSYSTYKQVYNEYVTEQISHTSITRSALRSSFEQYEVLLNIVSSQIIKNDQVADKEDILSLLQAATNLDSSVVAFGLFNLDGELYVSVPENPIPKGSSLLDFKQSKSSFQNTTEREGMLIGRTYYLETVDSIVVPFRIAVRDSAGKSRFVLSLAVSLEKGFTFFGNNVVENKLKNTFLYRETDRYFQLAPIDRINNPTIYQYQIPQALVDASVEHLVANIDFTYSQIKEREIIVTSDNRDRAGQSLMASVYMKDYKLWLITEVQYSVIVQTFIQKVRVLVLAYLISIALIFFLFRNIANSEKDKTIELSYQANHDYLTKLWNRHFFDRYLASVDINTVFSLIYLNIDHFKAVNDSYGHIYGDKLLAIVASRIKSSAKADEMLIRFSGDEFILLSFNKTKQQTSEICSQLLTCFDTPFSIGESEIILSASISVSLYPKDSNNPNDIKRNADLAMYSAKKEKRTAIFYDESMLYDYLHKRDIEHELNKAIVNDELYMAYQPQYSVDGSVVGVEALVRWQSPKLGFMPPDSFIYIAESIGSMDQIGTFVIERSLTDMLALQKSTGVRFSVSVNVSVKQFKKADFFENLMAIINKIGFCAELLILEVTESVLIEDIESIQHLMLKIKQQNIRISLDDFGTGYSSLSILKNLPIDELKIDKSFIADITTDRESRTMINGIISIAKNKNIITVAEGVETKDMLVELSKLDCDVFQGYYFSKPIDKAQLASLLSSQATSATVNKL
ncbi:EAL domain-containing protein [Alginatibacterium sediminis]|uniref:EAL domain-containing protein n=1 Tax=Alginatibacterium sediminis TaxID=2164068 RepID=A0A420EBG8_9ALTE|nr:EAL domain-containing protein [Alginatibacterium sediminis]RKF18025.1 EAL domain-containing protein [Alginatibacterium sediminis]